MKRNLERARAWQRRSKPLRATSKKRDAENRKRRQLIQRMSRNGPPRCVMCNALADDLHEVLSRARGGSTSDEENCVPLCRPCHTYVTEHPQWAAENGWLKHTWEESA